MNKLSKIIVFTFLILPFSLIKAASTPTPTPDYLEYDEIGAFYYDLPDNYNMESCEKIEVDNIDDVINDNLKLWECSNGFSTGNRYIPCNKDWVAAYAETATIPEFPLLQFFSAASFSGTEDNPVEPMCFYDIQANISSKEDGEDVYQFSGEYPGLIELTGASTTLNIKYPRLGTAVNCGVNEWRSDLGEMALDVIAFQELPPIPDDTVSSDEDNIFTFLINLIKHFNIFEISLKSRESNNIKTIADTLTEAGINNRETVCDSLPEPISKINVSDPIEPITGRSEFVINQENEILNYTDTEVCDLQFISGRVTGAECIFPNGTIFDGSKNLAMSLAFPLSINLECDTTPLGVTVCECKDVGPICGESFDCSSAQSEAYQACRDVYTTVADIRGDPELILSLPGFTQMVIPGANVTFANVVNILEQIHSPWEIAYGENWGIKLDVTRTAYDLNSRDQAYEPYKTDVTEYNSGEIDSNLRNYISYEESAYNYIYKDEFRFSELGTPTNTQFYFPFLGRLPYLLERISVIHSNALNPETAYYLTKGYLDPTTIAQDDSRTNVLGSFSSDIDEIIKPQIKYCTDLTEEEREHLDCYGDRTGDPVLEYLCSYDLASSYECANVCIEPESADNAELQNIDLTGLRFPVHDTSGFTITYGFGDFGDPYVDTKEYCSKDEENYYCHTGIDVGNSSTGTDIYAAGSGTVKIARNSDLGYGNRVVIEHTKDDGTLFWTMYAHLLEILVKVGDIVDQDTIVGTLGESGNASGPHLHFHIDTCEYSLEGIGTKNCYINPMDLAYEEFGMVRGASTIGPTTDVSNIDYLQSPNYDYGDTNRIQAIVYHHMGGLFDEAKAMFLDNSIPIENRVSAHYLIAKDGYILQMVHDKDIAWHAGLFFNGDEADPSLRADIVDANYGINPNNYTIGIELEGSGEPFTDAQYEALRLLTRKLVDAYNIPVDRYHLIGHYEIRRGKVDPIEMDWDRLIDLVQTTSSSISNNSSTTTNNSSSNNDTTSPSSYLPYCDNEDVDYNNGEIPANLNCLMKRVSDSINSWGSRISPEVIYGIAKRETSFNCAPTAGTLAEAIANPAECTGDPNQIAWPNPNGSGYDIRGLTQFMNGTFTSVINNYTDMMSKCIADIGISSTSVPPDLIDEGITSTNFTRKRVGDVLCATAILMSNYASNHNSNNYLTEEEWKTGTEDVINILEEAAADYISGPARTGCYGDCLIYIRDVPIFFTQALTNDVFANCDETSDSSSDVYALIYGHLEHEGILLLANGDPNGVIDIMDDYTSRVGSIASGKNVKSIISINVTGKHDLNTDMAEYERDVLEIIRLAKERGFYVMIDIQAPFVDMDEIEAIFEENLRKYLVEDNVFFDLDVEYTASVKGPIAISEMNRLISLYYRYRETKGYTNYAIFGFWLYDNDHIVKDTSFFLPNNGDVIAMYDGQNGTTSQCATKIGGYSSMVNYLSSLKHGFLFFDQANDINNAFPSAPFDKDGCSEELIYSSIQNVYIIGTW